MVSPLISLKGEGAWPGIDLQSRFEPRSGLFHKLENAYVTKDGTEIRRTPGFKKVADPGFYEQISMSATVTPNISQVGTTVTVFTIDDHGLEAGDEIFLSLSPESAILVNGKHTVASVLTSKSFTITVTISQTTSEHKPSQPFYVSRLKTPHGFKFHWGHTVIVAEDKFKPAASSRIDHLAAWVKQGPLSIVSDQTVFDYWKSPPRWADELAEDFGAIIRRSVLDTAGGKVLCASPGYGCCFEVDLYKKDLVAGDYLITALGMPKGEVYISPLDSNGTFDWGNIASITGAGTTATITTIAAHGQAGPTFTVFIENTRGTGGDLLAGVHTATVTGPNSFTIVASGSLAGKTLFGGNARLSNASGTILGHTGTTFGAGDYYVACAYRSENGEIGLVSDFRKITALAEFLSLQVVVARPRECLREAPVASEIIVYVGRDPGSLEVLGTFAGSGLSGRGTIGGSDLKALPPIPSASPKRERITKLEQMPMGAKWVRQIRATTFFGGTHGFFGSQNQADLYKMSAQGEDSGILEFVSIDTQAFVGGKVLPSSYQGAEVSDPPGSPTPLRIRLESLSSYLGLGSFDLHTFKTDKVGLSGSSTTAKLLLPKGHVWFSEKEHPEVTPAIARIIVDSMRGLDVEAAGRYSDSLILCTNAETYVVNYGRSPLGADARLISDEFGCVGPRTMVEIDQGLAWLSNRGPVAVTGSGLQWIGQAIFEDWSGESQTSFDSLRRDSEGMMHHSFGAHDPERGLVWFGVRTADGGYEDLTDEGKSFFGCDFFYLWSYRSNSWSTWTPPSSIGEIYDMDRCYFDDGKWRMCFLAGSASGGFYIYALDDAFGESASQVFSYDLQAQASPNTVTTVGDIDTEVVVGSTYVMFNSATGFKSEGTITAINRAPSGSDLVTLSESVTSSSGDKILFSAIKMHLETAYMTLDELDKEFQLHSAELRHSIDSTSPDGVAQLWFVDKDGTAVDASAFGDTNLDGYRSSMRGGAMSGAEAKVRLSIYANGAYSLKDIAIGVRGA